MAKSPKPRKALGRGLGSLIQSSDMPSPGGHKLPKGSLPLDTIDPNPNQPRTTFDAAKLEQLASSIKQHGLLQPIVVRPVGNRFQIVAGERRYRASKQAGLKEVPAIIKEVGDGHSFELALIENLQRENLSAMEEARGFAEYVDALELKQQDAANRLGISRSALSNKLRLLTLPATVQILIDNGDLSEGHARALLGIKDPNVLEQVAPNVVKQNLNVRQTEELARSLHGMDPKPDTQIRSTTKHTDPNIEALQNRLEKSLAMPTRIQAKPGPKGNKGRIVISYFSDEELQKISDLLLQTRT